MKGLRSLIAFFLLSLLAVPGALALPTVVVDAGHGGSDRGGQPGQRPVEKMYTLAVSQKVASKLRARGYRVVMTRTGDYFVGLRERCAMANSQRNAIFVSVHFNAAPRTSADGVETYYYSGKSLPLARAMHREILRVMRTDDRGVRRRGFYVVRKTRCPSVLLESAFLTNPAAVRRLNSSSFQDQLAEAIVRAVESRYR